MNSDRQDSISIYTNTRVPTYLLGALLKRGAGYKNLIINFHKREILKTEHTDKVFDKLAQHQKLKGNITNVQFFNDHITDADKKTIKTSFSNKMKDMTIKLQFI